MATVQRGTSGAVISGASVPTEINANPVNTSCDGQGEVQKIKDVIDSSTFLPPKAGSASLPCNPESGLAL